MIDLTKYTKYERGEKSLEDWEATIIRHFVPFYPQYGPPCTIVDAEGDTHEAYHPSAFMSPPSKFGLTTTEDAGLLSDDITAIYVPHALDGIKTFEQGICEPEEGKLYQVQKAGKKWKFFAHPYTSGDIAMKWKDLPIDKCWIAEVGPFDVVYETDSSESLTPNIITFDMEPGDTFREV